MAQDIVLKTPDLVRRLILTGTGTFRELALAQRMLADKFATRPAFAHQRASRVNT
ncbi:hypothetical protein ABL841_28070 [Variovorax paradoxus]|uniref:hypothetical protein n=1 Tax=Variovorax paradoxus TaxID=34073 RepID=UPI00036526D4|nr:hypothetical protein [Variovorax paradoxus]